MVPRTNLLIFSQENRKLAIGAADRSIDNFPKAQNKNLFSI
jgi:hypothetical protein